MSEEDDFTFEEQALPRKPRSWLVLSIIAAVFFCFPIGIFGIIFSCISNHRFKKKNYAGAEKASKIAGYFTIAAFATGILLFIRDAIYIYFIK
jgi:hypothetical protein